MTIAGGTTLWRMGAKTKGLEPEQRANVQRLLRTIVDRDFDGNQSKAARGLQVSQAFISDTVSGNRGAGNRLLIAMAKHLGVTIDDVLAGREARPERPSLTTVDYGDQFPNRARAMRAARELGTYSEESLAEVRSLRFADGQDMSPDEWLEEIKSAERRLKRGAQRGTPAGDLDVEPPGFEPPKKGKK
jgi:transcriptional regulator with XRE-family HTH domain